MCLEYELDGKEAALQVPLAILANPLGRSLIYGARWNPMESCRMFKIFKRFHSCSKNANLHTVSYLVSIGTFGVSSSFVQCVCMLSRASLVWYVNAAGPGCCRWPKSIWRTETQSCKRRDMAGQTGETHSLEFKVS